VSKLRLGALDEEKPVKLSVELGGALMRDLRAYAEVHAKLTGLAAPLPAERLVPAMVERFIAGDREFSKQRRRG
jgi:hypothetical protein